MDPRFLPLLLASNEFAPEHESEPLDRVRMQKGVFLLQMAGPTAWRDRFHFDPWDWGPFSRELAVELANLFSEGLIGEEAVPGRRHPAYRTTTDGENFVAEARKLLTNTETDFIASVRRYLTSRSFNQLLREVYAEYPEYAVASRFRS